jgi:hypothetical protein
VLSSWATTYMIEVGHQEAAIEVFLLAHEGHTQEVEVQCGAWSIYFTRVPRAATKKFVNVVGGGSRA